MLEFYIDRILVMNLTYPTTLVLHALANGSCHGFDVIDARVIRLQGRIHVDIGLVVARPNG